LQNRPAKPGLGLQNIIAVNDESIPFFADPGGPHDVLNDVGIDGGP
jgi:hypothetical protein